ncbi:MULTISPECIES: biotin transporter BioY [Clostridium]|uniref:Biotin transporter n=2 Tax=Clostridium TaxID=1485 RepID=A0A151AKA8_9CLOT|nr:MULTISPECIES: biotin transporter BioY [Clostridium]KYH28064.1 biotin transporter BioY [Clostridium colicanis DSM 13634]MBE6044909.1 biotin transporter BioY [Clostridium thermopalmarium]PRR71135.1 Biotin transporter BioY [Clostridium thermopalmarium DSM 5974]PVZ21003.1 biotin transport system substrate-specific component [Clostridium thermopalmarium DSM 5974]
MKISAKDMILVSLFTAVTAIGGFLSIPLKPVPITLQFLFTALSGIILGGKLGALSQITYVTLGLLGLPVFTKPGGLSYVFEPSFGYLIGFIFGAYVIGKITEYENNPSFIRLFLASSLGILVTYLIGVPYLYIILKYVAGASITFATSLRTGFFIFLPGDMIKCIITALIGVKIVPRIRMES